MKIFGIGLSKTGTNSLTSALRILGYDIWHYPPADMVEAIDNSDGCCDLPAVSHFVQLDKLYPNSKFILTMRNKHKWLASVMAHFKRRPSSTLGEWGKLNRIHVYGSLTPTIEQFARTYDMWHKQVFEYFADRPEDLLVVNITDENDAWEKICTFLDKEIPDMPFPHGNAKPTQTEQIDAVIPYVVSRKDWAELRYALRALEQNFLDLNRVFLVGDLPDWIDPNSVVWVPNPEGSQDANVFQRNYHFCRALWLAAELDQISEEFLYLADDHYILTPRTANDFRDVVLVKENMAAYTQEQRRTGDTDWQRMLWKTVDRLLDAGHTGWNHETHTPKLVNKANLRNCMAHMGFGQGDLIWQTAYFNMYPPREGAKAYLVDESGLKAGFYRNWSDETQSELEYLEIKAKGDAAVFLNHNDEAICAPLLQYIDSRFPEPSRFEKP